MVPGRSVTVSSDAHLHKDFSTYWILLLLLFSHFKIITLSPLAYMFQTISIILYLIFFSPRHHSWRAHFLAGEADSHSLCYFSGDFSMRTHQSNTSKTVNGKDEGEIKHERLENKAKQTSS